MTTTMITANCNRTALAMIDDYLVDQQIFSRSEFFRLAFFAFHNRQVLVPRATSVVPERFVQGMRITTVTISPQMRETIQAAIARSDYQNTSDYFRRAIDFLLHYPISGEGEPIVSIDPSCICTVNLSKASIAMMAQYVEEQNIFSRSEFVRLAFYFFHNRPTPSPARVEVVPEEHRVGSKITTINLSRKIQSVVNRLVATHQYKSRSAYFRQAIDYLLHYSINAGSNGLWEGALPALVVPLPPPNVVCANGKTLRILRRADSA